MGTEFALQELDALQHDYVDIVIVIALTAKLRGGLLREVGFNLDGAMITQREDELGEHIVESQAMAEELAGRIGVAESNRREIQPPIDMDPRRPQTRRLKGFDKARCDIPLTAAINAADGDKNAALRRRGAAHFPDSPDYRFEGRGHARKASRKPGRGKSETSGEREIRRAS